MELIRGFEAQYLAEFQKSAPITPNTNDPLIYVGGLLQTTQVGLAIAIVKKRDGTQISDSWIKFR